MPYFDLNSFYEKRGSNFQVSTVFTSMASFFDTYIYPGYSIVLIFIS